MNFKNSLYTLSAVLPLLATCYSPAAQAEGENLIVAENWTSTTGYSDFTTIWCYGTSSNAGYIQQAVSTTAGAEHTLNFDWSAYGYFGSGIGRVRATVYDASNLATPIADSGILSKYVNYNVEPVLAPSTLTFTPEVSDIVVRFTGNQGIGGCTTFRYATAGMVFNMVLTAELLPPNAAPIADAGGDQSIRAGDTVNLDGNASSDDNTLPASLGYSWSFFSKPAFSTATLAGAGTATPSFVADEAGLYVVDLVVTDDAGLDSLSDSVEISSDNLAPTAVAGVGASLVIVGDTSTFDGSGSFDPENDSLSYAWTITTAPMASMASLVGDNTVNPTLISDSEGSYKVTLTVSDFLGAGTPATIEVVATSPANYAEIQIVDASVIVESLSLSQVTTKGNKTAFGNFLKNATKDIQKGEIADAIGKLNQALVRTDGCALNGSPDGNGNGMDWITDCNAQAEVYDLLQAAINALTP